MILRQTGPAVRVPPIELTVHIGGGRQAPWGWCTGAPYQEPHLLLLLLVS